MEDLLLSGGIWSSLWVMITTYAWGKIFGENVISEALFYGGAIVMLIVLVSVVASGQGGGGLACP